MNAPTGFTPRELRCLASTELPPDVLAHPAIAAMCVGSVARGWSNATSDVDVNVIAANPPERATERIALPLGVPAVPVLSHYGPTRRWEIKYWSPGQVDEVLEKVSGEAFEAQPMGADVLTSTEELLLDRALDAIPLVGEVWIRSLCGRIMSSAFRSFMVARSFARMDSALEDAIGQRDAGDVDSAVLSARRAFGHAVDAMLESSGIFGSAQPKWRARRVKAGAVPGLSYDEYWSYETMRHLDRDDPNGWIDDVAGFCWLAAIDTPVQ